MGQPDVRASTRKKNATNRRLAWLGQRLYCQRRLATKEEEEEKEDKSELSDITLFQCQDLPWFCECSGIGVISPMANS